MSERTYNEALQEYLRNPDSIPTHRLDQLAERIGLEPPSREVLAGLRRSNTLGRARNIRADSKEHAVRVAALLTRRNIPATPVEVRGGWYAQVAHEEVVIQASSGIAAPEVIREGRTLRAIGKIDKGPARIVEDDDVRREFDDVFHVEMLRADVGKILTREKLEGLAHQDVCAHCGRHEGKGYRRYLAIVQDDTGFLVLGTTCFVKLFGVPFSEIYPADKVKSESKGITDWAVQTGAREIAEIKEELHAALGRKYFTEALKREDEALTSEIIEAKMVEVIDRDNVKDGRLVNALQQLRAYAGRFTHRRWGAGEDACQLNEWGRSILASYRHEVDPQPETDSEPPEVGSAVQVTGRVLRKRDRINKWGRWEWSITIRCAGRDYWIGSGSKSWNPVEEGDTITVLGTVGGHARDGKALTFLNQPGLVEVVTEAEAQASAA